ncbi:hypothetical protein PIB30_046833 [Stylosanthes scabra]|uniref:Uncharacterized protein n=1 Tax=Stylosanthes scabra TaxID=79078 RepID=A0ABU6VJG3_9FABA|nr:hypothetical protein [Stylosanthes scabra]
MVEDVTAVEKILSPAAVKCGCPQAISGCRVFSLVPPRLLAAIFPWDCNRSELSSAGGGGTAEEGSDVTAGGEFRNVKSHGRDCFGISDGGHNGGYGRKEEDDKMQDAVVVKRVGCAISGSGVGGNVVAVASLLITDRNEKKEKKIGHLFFRSMNEESAEGRVLPPLPRLGLNGKAIQVEIQIGFDQNATVVDPKFFFQVQVDQTSGATRIIFGLHWRASF